MSDQIDVHKHPIKVVARRTGLTPDVIRVWERRYGAVQPERSSGSRRLYSDSEVERLRLLRLGTLAGRRISELAGLSDEELTDLVQLDGPTLESGQAERVSPSPASERLESCMQAVRDLDGRRLLSLLNEATVELSPQEFIQKLILALLHEVGEEWRSGRIRVAHEHMATSIIRAFIQTMHADRDLPLNAPEIVIATPAGQRHEMGALLASVAASAEGWRVTYLGNSLPAEDLAAAVRQRRAKILALSIVYPADDPSLPEELRRIRRLLGDHIAIWVGGRSVRGYADTLAMLQIQVVADLEDFRLGLDRARLLTD